MHKHMKSIAWALLLLTGSAFSQTTYIAALQSGKHDNDVCARGTSAPVVGVAPTILSQPVDLSANEGDTAIFRVIANGVPDPTYQWFQNALPVRSAIEATLVLPNVGIISRGTYHVVVTNASGSVTSQDARLYVLQPPTWGLAPVDTTVSEGGTFTLVAVASNFPTAQTYQWYHNDVAVPGATAPSLTVAVVKLSDAGQYYNSATNAAGTTNSPSATVTVTPNVPTIPPGYYAADDAPAGTGDGAHNSPWNLRDVLLTGKTMPPGATLQLKPGEYDDPQKGVTGTGDTVNRTWLDREYKVGTALLPVSDLHIMCEGNDYYTARVKGGFSVNGNRIRIEGILFENPDPHPGPTPTAIGTPYPGYSQTGRPYDPLAWADWGSVGIHNESGNENHYVNLAAYGGTGSYSNYSGNSIVFHGCISYRSGWLGKDRLHGHGLYARNRSADPASRNYVTNNIFSTKAMDGVAVGYKTRAGQYSVHFYSENDPIQNLTADHNLLIGAVTARTTPQLKVHDLVFTGNIAVASQPPALTRGFSFGTKYVDSTVTPLVAFDDGQLTLTDNTFVSAYFSANDNNFTSLTSTGNRVVNPFPGTAATQWNAYDFKRVPGVLKEEEERDVMTNTFWVMGGSMPAEEARLYVSAFNPTKHAKLFLLDFDNDGRVWVDLSMDIGGAVPFLSNGDTYEIKHYTDVATVLMSGTYSGPVEVPIQDSRFSPNTGSDSSIVDGYVVEKTN
jgi:hypothetical protein